MNTEWLLVESYMTLSLLVENRNCRSAGFFVARIYVDRNKTELKLLVL